MLSRNRARFVEQYYIHPCFCCFKVEDASSLLATVACHVHMKLCYKKLRKLLTANLVVMVLVLTVL